MSRKSRRKGDAFELEAKKAFQAAGFDCVKTGAFKKDDLLVGIDGQDRIVECKRRKRGFHSLYSFISGAWAVVHRDDHQEALITLRLDDFLTLRGRG